MTTATLTEFLLARIAEDEAAVRREMPGRWTNWLAQTRPGLVPDLDPRLKRALAECEAKRRIVDVADEAPGVLRFLALPYAEHADYREEWEV
jgi:hypothetical protein